MYETEKDKAFYCTLSILKYTYCIPTKIDKSNLFSFTIKFILIRLAAFMNFVVMPCIHLIITVRANNGVDISEDLSTLIGGLGVIITICSYLILYKEWTQFLIDLEDCKKFGTHAGFDILIKRLNLYSILYALFILLGITTYGLFASLETSYCKRFNEEHGLNEICGSFTPVVLPFDGNNVYVRSFIFVLQFVLALFTFTPTAAVCFLLYESGEILCSHISLLKECFINVFEVSSESRDRLRFCIYYHDNILRLCARLNTLGKYTFGFICIICGMVFACIENVMASKPIAGLMYLMGYVVALFWICHGGQRIMDETLSICDAVYASKWYEGDARIMRDIRFILARAQRPVILEAIPVGGMNYPLFLMILRTSYTYLTLLNQST